MRLYRALLHLLPASFRAEYGGDMAAIFARRRREARGPLAAAGVWIEALGDLVASAARVHADLTRHDLRDAARSLRRAPGFALTALLVAALGIGATTSALSFTDHVFLRPLPFPDADRLVRLWQSQTARGYSRMELSPPNYRDWTAASTSFSRMAAFWTFSANLVGAGDPVRLEGVRATADLFPLLGVQAAHGRYLTAADHADGAPDTVVLSDGLWRTAFGADPAVVGRPVLLNDVPHVVVGVMPPGFAFPDRDVSFWTRYQFTGDDSDLDRSNYYLDVVAELAPGVTVDAARAELTVITARLAEEYPAVNEGTGATVVPLRGDVSPQTRLLLMALVGASLCLLLIACLNLANLLLARALARQQEIAIRAAMGAGRRRLVRQMITESLLLAVPAGVAGVALALAAAPFVSRLVPTTLPLAAMPGLDLRLLAVAAGVTLVTGLGFGVLPAVRMGAEVDPLALREGTRTSGSRRTERIRGALVVAEVTASVVLLVSSGLLVRALWRVQDVDPGFRSEQVLTLRTSLPLPAYETVAARQAFYRRVTSEVEALPGVDRAAYTTALPMVWRGGIWPVGFGADPVDPTDARTASLRFVTPGYFEAMGIPLLAGRDVAERDTQDTQFVAVVSESFARQHWPGEDPIGRGFFMAFQDRVVVGVVGDVRVRGLERASEPQVYLPAAQVPDGGLVFYAPQDLVVKADIASGTLIPTIREIVRRADPRQPVSDVRALSAIVAAESAPRLVQVRVLVAFAAAAFLLAGIGLHGLLVFAVSARAREFGVRIALGATRRDIVRLVLGRGLLLGLVGAAVGAALAYAAGRTMASLLAGLSPADPATFAAAIGLALLLTVAGSVLPARRATRVDPVLAMRAE